MSDLQEASQVGAAPMIKAEGLCKFYGDFAAVRAKSLRFWDPTEPEKAPR